MKKNKLREHIKKGQPLLSTRFWSTQPFFWEAIGETGIFDYVEFLAEYAPYDLTDLPNIARAAELNDMGTMTFKIVALLRRKQYRQDFRVLCL